MKIIQLRNGEYSHRAVNIGDFCYNLNQLKEHRKGAFAGSSLVLIADPVKYQVMDGKSVIIDLTHSQMKMEVSTERMLERFKERLVDNCVYGLTTILYNHKQSKAHLLIANRHL